MSPAVLFALFLTANRVSLSALSSAATSSIIHANPGTQRIPSSEDHKLTVQCFSEFVGSYGYRMSEEKLPPRNTSLLISVMLDSSQLCSNFKELNTCLDGQYEEVVDFDCLTSLTSSSDDADFYLNQFSMAEFFCKYSVPFIDYSQCQELIADDSNGTFYSQCSQDEWSSCKNVAESLICRRSLVEAYCGSSSAVCEFCTYQRIPLRMTGWNACPDIPCSVRHLQLVKVFFSVLLSMYVWF